MYIIEKLLTNDILNKIIFAIKNILKMLSIKYRKSLKMFLYKMILK